MSEAMDSSENKTHKNTDVTQVSFGGFTEHVSAEELANFLEYAAGTIYRCRLKTSWTPPDSYPDYKIIDAVDSLLPLKDSYIRAVPHAFVHFAVSDGAKRAIDAAGRCELILNGHLLRAILGSMDSSFRVSRRRTMDPIKFPNVCIEVGTLIGNDEFWVSWSAPSSGADFVIDPLDGCCKIQFSKNVSFAFKGTKDMVVIKCDFKVEFLAREIDEIKVYADRAPFVMLVHLSMAPWIYYRTGDDDTFDSVPFNLLDDDDPWIRTTDFTPNGAFGRCNAFKISFSPRYGAKLEKGLNYMRERMIPENRPKVCLNVRYETDYEFQIADPVFSVLYKPEIGFAAMFLVNALVHKSIVSHHQVSDDFFELLRSQCDELNIASLKHICSNKHPIYDAYDKLKAVQEWLLRTPKLIKSSALPNDNVEVRRLVITPTKAYCLPSEVELSNRVLRNYKEVSDRFLRVSFTDEGMQSLTSNVLTYHVAPIIREITANSFPQKTMIFKRIKSVMTDGFQLCGRKYSFLAFSPNQLRDRSAWFFAEDENITVASIRTWMGRFSNRNVAKCAARMGQCFSSTYATINMPHDKVDWSHPDIERNGYVFSDGIGKLTPELALEIAEKLQLSHNPPCAYQIRYAGCKGVIAAWPGNNEGIQLSLRPSMIKFESDHAILEIASWTRFQPGFINRQIVTLLSTLGIPDIVFEKLQDSMIGKLNQMKNDRDVAVSVVTKSCSEQGNSAVMMLQSGFDPQKEPHLKAMLSCIRFSQLKDIMMKTRLFVPQGRWLMGCLDELGVLEHGQCFVQVSEPGTNNDRFIITGTVVIAKNPCLHPGDIRILEAVDEPGLHHLVDCLVFPQQGERPHSNEASGSDLDGDLYFVTWDEDLIPPGKKSWVPMDYTSGEIKQLPREVTLLDIIDLFMKNMVNENLGVICNAHVVHADLSEYGALDEKCLQLAELAATAVDFPKTGKLVTMPQSLRPRIYPDFMGKDDVPTYKSVKILGKLYRKIKEASVLETEIDCTCDIISYDADLEVPGASQYLDAAWHSKYLYDGRLNALLGQYRVRSEAEVITGHVWSMPRYNSRKQGELKERLKNSFFALHEEFRRVFEAGDDENCRESKASAWYQVTYHPLWVEKGRELKGVDGDVVPTRLSFAWIAVDHLTRIKKKSMESKDNSVEAN